MYELWDFTNQSEEPLDPEVFPSYDLTSATKTLGVQTNNAAKVGLYELIIRVFFENSRER